MCYSNNLTCGHGSYGAYQKFAIRKQRQLSAPIYVNDIENIGKYSEI